MKNITIPYSLMRELTADKERNIYVHPNFFARWIFWSRLKALHSLLLAHTERDQRAADVGGGSGAFLPALASLFSNAALLDLDCSDAYAIKNEYGLEQVEIREGNIFEISADEKFEVMVFADVLEHFEDLAKPIDWIEQHMTSEGMLAVSLPTENWLYELGRFLIRKQKPLDHYHRASDVIARLQQSGFRVIAQCYRPLFFLPVPLFRIALLQKGPGQ